MILQELFKYFSRFVPKAVLGDTFQASSGTAYNTFKTAVLALPDARRQNAIKSFIIGIDAEAIRERISQAPGTYLFVEYSTISTRIDHQTDRKEDRLHVAVTVATPFPNDQDQPANLLNSDDCLSIMRTIRQSLRDDFDATAKLIWCEFPNSMQPFYNKALANSSGWTMEFDILGYDVA